MTQGSEDGGSISVADFVGQAFGDLSDSDVMPEGTDDAGAGAPPSPSAPEPTLPPVEPEGTPAAEPQATPADAAAPAPDAPVVDADPLASATALSYVVDGQTKTYDGVKVIDGGAIIDSPAVLADLQRKLGERDHLYGANQALYAQVKQYEALGGEAKYAELNEQLAMVNAAGSLLVPLVAEANPNELLKLLQQDEYGNIVWNEGARGLLLGNLKLATERAQLNAGQTLRQSVSDSQRQASESQQVEQVRQQGINEAKATVASNFPDWHPADIAALDKHLTTYSQYLIRPATAADVKQFPSLAVGKMFIDYPKLGPWLEERQSMRQSAAKVATTTASATKENAARLAAAVRPTKTSTPAAKTAPTAPANSRQSDADAAWDMQEKLMVSAMRGSAR